MAAPDSADQVLVDFSHYVTSDGVRRSRLEADTAFVYERTGLTELRRVRGVFYDDRGAEASRLASERATLRPQDGALTAAGFVVVRTADGRELRSERLVYDKSANRISTDTSFTYVADGTRMQGDSFESDIEFKNIVASRPRGTAERGMVIPGQGAAGDSARP
jgi:LPS export ABC transporter protein LptC